MFCVLTYFYQWVLHLQMFSFCTLVFFFHIEFPLAFLIRWVWWWWIFSAFLCLGKTFSLFQSWRLDFLGIVFLVDSCVLSALWKCPTPSWPVCFLLRSLLPDELELLYMLFAFRILFLFLTFESLIIICLGVVLFESNLFILWPGYLSLSQVLKNFLLLLLWISLLCLALAQLPLRHQSFLDLVFWGNFLYFIWNLHTFFFFLLCVFSNGLSLSSLIFSSASSILLLRASNEFFSKCISSSKISVWFFKKLFQSFC